jgi:hypothetical protein
MGIIEAGCHLHEDISRLLRGEAALLFEQIGQ